MSFNSYLRSDSIVRSFLPFKHDYGYQRMIMWTEPVVPRCAITDWKRARPLHLRTKPCSPQTYDFFVSYNSWWRSVAVRLLTKSHSHIKRCKAAVGWWWYSRRMCCVGSDPKTFQTSQDARTLAQRQSYESQESCKDSAELAYERDIS